MLGHIDMDQSGGCELAKDALPRVIVEIATNAKGWQLFMVPLLDLVGRLAAQDISQVRHTEAHAGAEDGGKGVLRRQCAIPQFRRVLADITVVTGLAVFAEIVEQYLAAATWRFALGE